MSYNNHVNLWDLTTNIQVHPDLQESITKISNIDNHLYLQTSSNLLYHGTVENSGSETPNLRLNLELWEHFKIIDIDSCRDKLYVVDLDGNVWKLSKNLEKPQEIFLYEDYQCSRGHTGTKCKMKVAQIAVGDYGQLFVTDGGILWASGYMPQIGVNTESPKRVSFFSGRQVFSVNIGNDFAIAIVSKLNRSEDPDSDEEDVFMVTNCPQCLSASQLTSPGSLNSISEICPLGQKVQGSYDIETTSTSSKNDSSTSLNDRKLNVSTEPDDFEKSSMDETSQKVEKNIIFRNTEAAKEFLTRQISRMSSAGEEYLVECTEKPTRILKENMTNVASFVYEGVKTVGDKVVTLSRHVSGSSDCNSVHENSCSDFTNLNVPKSGSCVFSLSQCTSDRDLTEKDIRERVGEIAKMGARLINCEVWTWGNIIHGQLDRSKEVQFMPKDCVYTRNPLRLIFNRFVGTRGEYALRPDSGIGDIIKRERPMIITKLSNIGVQKVSVQNYHASVLTLDGRAFIWGRNDHNQVTVDTNIDQSSPKLYNANKAERVKDIISGENFTSVLIQNNSNDSENYNKRVTYFGKGSDKILSLEPKFNSITCDNKKNCARGRIGLFRNLLSSSQYSCLNYVADENIFKNGLSSQSFDVFLVEEQRFLEEMLGVQLNIIKPLQKKNLSTPDPSLYEDLCKNYLDLLYFYSANVQSLLEYSNNLISICDIKFFKFLEEFIYVFKNYFSTIFDLVSIDGFQSVAKLIEISQSLCKLRPLSFTTKKDKNNEEVIIKTFLLAPLDNLTQYTQIIQSFYPEINQKWSSFVEEQEHKKNLAEATREFWLNSGGTVEFLKSPSRRLIRDSHKFPIHLLNAGRFSSHWFVLFSDLFVHMNGSTPHSHNLTTIWLESQQDENSHNQQYQICMKMPEDVITLYTSEAETKIDWFRNLQTAIKEALNKSDALQPPSVRNGSYNFLKSGFFKDSTYTGRWLNGKMHGNGKVQWPDGKIYTGQFSNSQISGFGVMEIPNVGIYEGQWKDNQQNGFGTYTYANTDVYKGFFKDGLPHGHGFLRKGNFMANAASFYIGDWVAGLKNGYGVMDDIVSGEKYIGSWLDGKRNGNGLIVTSDGAYYEGLFNQDVLTGQGVMILEDGTHYEGEFRGTGLLNGKGTLTLPSGHTIDGNLTGSWSEGIKISNGTFVARTPELTLPKSFKEFCTPPNQKWKSLFRHCHQVLGIPGDNPNSPKNYDTHKIWQNVAVYLSNASNAVGRRGKVASSLERSGKFQASLNHLDIIPPFGRDKLDFGTYQEVKNYLAKAFESNFHLLGSLLTDLTEAYTTTYGGRAHPLLLTHAINELHYICKRLYGVVRFLFPALPTYDKEVLVENSLGCEEVCNYQSLLYPLILPKVHHNLFTLFTLKNELEERQYKKTLSEWNKQADYGLMAFLSVDQKFLDADDLNRNPHVFEEAIETLQQLKSTFSPTEKLLVIRQTVEKMTPVAQELLGKEYIWNMDDLFPIFLFVVVRARIPDLGSELDFVDNFMDPSLESGELGIMYTTLKACYQQILQEKSSSYQ